MTSSIKKVYLTAVNKISKGNIDAAKKLLEKCIKADYLDSFAAYGKLCEESDPEKACLYYKQAADKGSIEAYCHYLLNHDKKKLIDYLTIAEFKTNPNPIYMYFAAVYYQSEIDEEEYSNYIQQLADRKCKPAYERYALLLQK